MLGKHPMSFVQATFSHISLLIKTALIFTVIFVADDNFGLATVASAGSKILSAYEKQKKKKRCQLVDMCGKIGSNAGTRVRDSSTSSAERKNCDDNAEKLHNEWFMSPVFQTRGELIF